MASLFNQAQADQINAIAAKSKTLKPVKASRSITATQNAINESTQAVLEYFKDSPAILITTREQLHEYVLKAIEAGYCGIDTETTGLDRIRDTIVGASLYYPGGVECYIPSKHRTLVDTYYKEQLSYEDIGAELQLFVDAGTKMIFANADFDIAMIYKDFKVDMIDVCYYDVILAWRCLKEDEKDNALKTLYWKYPNKGKGSPKKFADFFSPKYFPYSRPDVAKLYAANDAKITYELFAWQLPYVTKSNPKCQKHHLEKIADLIWNIEFPMIRVCALMHRTGIYLDLDSLNALKKRYHDKYDKESAKLAAMVQEVIDQADIITINKSPFKTGEAFNQASPPQVKYLFNQFMHLNLAAADKEVLKELNLPIANQILKVRSISTLINGFIDKMTGIVGPDGKIHSTFKSIGADTGRMSSSEPNVQNIPSHALDIRHQFRATPAMMKVSNCTVEDGYISIVLGNYDTVWLEGDIPAKVNTLKAGNHIILTNNKKPISGIIRSIEDRAPNSYITIDVDMTSSILSYQILHQTPAYVLMSSDYSQQEPKVTAYISQDPKMIEAFKNNKDIYATIAALSFNSTYEECLEFNPITGENQPEGKERRSNAKKVVLGITYGMSIPSLGEQVFGNKTDMTEEEKTKAAQKIYDAVLAAFPNLRAFMVHAQSHAAKYGYVETILGRRRHIPDMQLPRYQFQATKKYVNPDIDPLDPETLKNKNEIPERVIKQLEKEFANYKYMGQVYKRIKELDEKEHIKVIVNNKKINDASRKCVNSMVQGSAAELTKIAILKVFNDPEWNALGGRVLLPVHDELIAEIPIDNYDKGEQILSRLMSEAGSFFPFTISCDVTTTHRWYGLSYPCIYEEPSPDDILDENLPESKISWIQYHLFEMEYTLPIVPNADGSKLEGDAALGVNGIWSEALKTNIDDYVQRYHIEPRDFVVHIKDKVINDLQI